MGYERELPTTTANSTYDSREEATQRGSGLSEVRTRRVTGGRGSVKSVRYLYDIFTRSVRYMYDIGSYIGRKSYAIFRSIVRYRVLYRLRYRTSNRTMSAIESYDIGYVHYDIEAIRCLCNHYPAPRACGGDSGRAGGQV